MHQQRMLHPLLTYVTRHPDAKDAIDGILGWWLAECRPPAARVELQLALDDLTQRGWMAMILRPGTPRLYQLNPDHLCDIQEYLAR